MKMFKCPQCKEVSTSEEWNKQTEIKYGTIQDKSKIENVRKRAWEYTNFVCPHCKKDSIDRQFEEIPML